MVDILVIHCPFVLALMCVIISSSGVFLVNFIVNKYI